MIFSVLAPLALAFAILLVTGVLVFRSGVSPVQAIGAFALVVGAVLALVFGLEALKPVFDWMGLP